MKTFQANVPEPVSQRKNPHAGHIVLAPMEGVINAPMRRFLTSIGGYTRCVTEFVRVTDVLLPEKVFFRMCPELAEGGRTESGVPVFTQLLGSNAPVLAVNAKRAVSLGAPGIDLNFGCPAKTVNNSMGGSILLRQPAVVADIVRAVRDAVPASVPVTAKIRLGYDNPDNLAEIVASIHQAGATELAIHARTKFDGYKPPAWWSVVKPVMQGRQRKTYINGEIWTVKDSLDAREQSGCEHVMLGRGALASPDLAQRILLAQSAAYKAPHPEPMPWEQIVERVEAQFLQSDCQSVRHIGNRTKQWLVYLKRTYPAAEDLFALLRRLHDVPGITKAFAMHRSAL